MLKTLVSKHLDGRHEEYQYIDLIKDILNDGQFIEVEMELLK